MRFMVCRKEAVESRIKTSGLFSTIVDAPIDATYEDVVRIALDSRWPGYNPMNKSYYVVPMDGAVLVHFRRPQPSLEVVVERNV